MQIYDEREIILRDKREMKDSHFGKTIEMQTATFYFSLRSDYAKATTDTVEEYERSSRSQG